MTHVLEVVRLASFVGGYESYGYLCVGFCKKCMGKSIAKANE